MRRNPKPLCVFTLMDSVQCPRVAPRPCRGSVTMSAVRGVLVIATASSVLIAGLTGRAASQTINAPPSSSSGSGAPSAIGAPMTPLAPLPPLSPQVVTTPLSGGTVRNDMVPSPTTGSASPSELAQSIAGGGGRTLKDCMNFWDRATHMTKSEWRDLCQRSLHRLDNLKINGLMIGAVKAKH